MRFACIAALALVLMGAAAASVGPLKPSWTVRLPNAPSTTPLSALSGPNYFVNDINGTVWSVDTLTHEVKWSLRWDDLSALVAYPLRDVLLVQVQEGTWAVKGTTGELLWVNNTYQLTAAAAVDKWIVGFNTNSWQVSGLSCIDVTTGKQDWWFNAASWGQTFFTVGGTALVVNQSTVNLAMAIDVATAKTLWQKPVYSVLGAGNGLIVALNQANGSDFLFTYDLLLMDPATGETAATFKNFTQSDSLQVTFDPNGSIVLTDGQTFIAAVDSVSFTRRFYVNLANVESLPFGVQSLVIAPTAILAISNANASSQSQLFNLTSMSRTTGEVKWTVNYPPTTAAHTVAVLGKLVIVPNLIGYVAIDAETGAIVYKNYRDGVPVEFGTQMQLSANAFVAQNPDGSVSAFEF